MKKYFLVSLLFHLCLGLALRLKPSIVPLPLRTTIAVQITEPPKVEPKKIITADPNLPKAAKVPYVKPVVGINVESTSEQSTEAVEYNVGNTRMGQTDPVPQKNVEPNKRVTILPDDSNFQAPVRLAEITPYYPPMLKAQGIEADVLLSVDIDNTGNVAKIAIVRAAKFPEFNDAAKAAAEQTRYKPALYKGEAVAYSIQYTVRFRIVEN